MDKFYGGRTQCECLPAASNGADDGRKLPLGQPHPASTYAAAYAMDAMADHPSIEDVREAFQQKYGVAHDAS